LLIADWAFCRITFPIRYNGSRKKEGKKNKEQKKCPGGNGSPSESGFISSSSSSLPSFFFTPSQLKM
jgi:hypothetical protein